MFAGLTQMINESNYLVPQMTRDQKRMAIEGPIAVGGGRISNRLLKRLLADLGDNQDQAADPSACDDAYVGLLDR